MAQSDKKSDKSKTDKTRQKAKERLKAKRKNLHDRPPVSINFLLFCLLCITSLAVAFFLIPSKYTHLHSIKTSMIGEYSTVNIKSPRNSEIIDPITTAKRRQEAEINVKPVYDWSIDTFKQIITRIQIAFSPMQTAYAKFIRKKVTIPDKNNTKKIIDNKSSTQADKDELDNIYNGLKDEFIKTLQVVVRDDQFDILKELNFSPSAEQGLISLFRRLQDKWIIESIRLLITGRNNSITVSYSQSDEVKPIEKTVKKNEITDIAAVQKILITEANDVLRDYNTESFNVLLHLAKELIKPNLTFNPDKTKKRKISARKKIKPTIIPLKKGEMIIRDGELISERHAVILKGLQDATKQENTMQIFLGLTLLTGLMIFTIYSFGKDNIRKFKSAPKNLVLLTIILIMYIILILLND